MVQEEVETEKHKGVERGSNCLATVHSVTSFMLALLYKMEVGWSC